MGFFDLLKGIVVGMNNKAVEMNKKKEEALKNLKDKSEDELFKIIKRGGTIEKIAAFEILTKEKGYSKEEINLVLKEI